MLQYVVYYKSGHFQSAAQINRDTVRSRDMDRAALTLRKRLQWIRIDILQYYLLLLFSLLNKNWKDKPER
jgi:hypothetical protein